MQPNGVAIALALLCVPSVAAAEEAARKTNVLFIAVDDLNTALGCYGHPVAKSPHIDRLAKRGVRFERAYCQYPLCNPTRSSLLTGLYPTTTTVLDNRRWFRHAMPEAVTIPQHFRANGYVTLRAGKIFHGGLDDDRGWLEGGEPYREPKARTPEEQAARIRRADRWVALPGKGEDQPDYRTATRAIELLEKHKEKPFFLAVGFVKPHVPLIAPKSYFDLYDPAKIELPKDFAPEPSAKEGVPADALRGNFDLFIRREATEEQARQARAAYYATTSFMDAQVGRVLEALDRLKLADRTVIVFFSDHGFHLGEKGMWSKMTLFEDSARVPMIIAAPGHRTAGKVSPRTVELLDLYPTLVELCGLPKVQGLEGKSLVALLKDPEAAWDKPALTYLQRGKVLGKSVRTERYRYTEWDAGRKGTELYDYQTDPNETRNLAADPKQVQVVQQMKRLLK